MACEFRIAGLAELLWELHQHLKQDVTKGLESLPVFFSLPFFYSEQNTVVLQESALPQGWQSWCAASPSQAEQPVHFRLE